MAIQARPTTYNGIRMRSRLEAAFAADLDATGAAWEYEPQCFASPEGQYLPDFRVDGTYVEVKPSVADFDDAMARMHIILASEPDAQLFVVTSPAIGQWQNKRWCKPCRVSPCTCTRQRGPCSPICGCLLPDLLPDRQCDGCDRSATWITHVDGLSGYDGTLYLCDNCKTRDATRFSAGDDVRHPRHGEGIILSIEGEGGNAIATVYFHHAGERLLLLSWSPLEKLHI